LVIITTHYQLLPIVYIGPEKGFDMTDQETLTFYSQFFKKLIKVKNWFKEEQRLNLEFIKSKENQSEIKGGLMDTKCKICGKECSDIFRNYCSFECLNDAMQKQYASHA